MTIDDFPFEKFKKYNDEQLINKVARYSNNHDLEEILNVYAKLGMIEAEEIQVDVRMDRYNNVSDYGIRILGTASVCFIRVPAKKHHDSIDFLIWSFEITIAIITIYVMISI